jgi:hypothetical protein
MNSAQALQEIMRESIRLEAASDPDGCTEMRLRAQASLPPQTTLEVVFLRPSSPESSHA